LLVQNYCSDDYRISDNTPDNDGLVGTTASDIPSQWCTSESDTTGGAWITQNSNWQGPYLTTTNPDYEPKAFSDGWGTQATVLTDHNYGWNFTGTDSNSDGFFEDLTIQSYGKDQASGQATTSEYDLDYPGAQPAILANDWLVNIQSGFQVTFNTSLTVNTSDRNSCLSSGGAWKNTCNITQSICESTTGTAALNGYWVSASSFDYCKLKKGDASTFCKKERGTNLRAGNWKNCHFLSEQSCQLARGVWREKYTTTTDTTCNDVTASDDCAVFTVKECEGAGGVFDSGKCFICNIEDTDSCKASINDSTFAEVYPSTEVNCRKAGGNWDSTANICIGPNFCEFPDTQSCRNIGGNWSESCLFDYKTCIDATGTGVNSTWNANPECSKELPEQLLFKTKPSNFNIENIKMEIKYIDDGNLNTITSNTSSVQENGKMQNIIFSGFSINNLPAGNSQIFVFKNTNDIYPASCSGLTQTDCKGADGGDTTNPARLLANGMCDNLTIDECNATTDGKLIRNRQNILIVPHKNIGTINW